MFRLVAVLWTGEPIGSLFLAPLGLRLKSDGPRAVPSDEILAIGGEIECRLARPEGLVGKGGRGDLSRRTLYFGGVGPRKKELYLPLPKGRRGLSGPGHRAGEGPEQVLGPFLCLRPSVGFLPLDLQTALEFYGRYRPRPYVVLSIGITFLTALAMIGPGLKNVSLGVFEIWALLKLAVALLLFMESILRLLRLVKDGRASGSILAFLVKPVYHLAFKDRPAGRF